MKYENKFDFNDENFCFKYLIDKTFHNEKAINEYTGSLYHYTSNQGLVGILESQKLWATNYSFLNESSELNYGMKLSIELLEMEIKKYSNDTLNKYSLILEEALKNKLAELNQIKKVENDAA